MFFFFFQMKGRHNAKTVGEIKQFVSQLPHMQAERASLANHTSIAELIKDITSKTHFFLFYFLTTEKLHVFSLVCSAITL